MNPISNFYLGADEPTRWMHPSNIYVVSGGASANSLFLEDKECHEIFFGYFNRFLKDMLEVLHYKLTATGWAMLIKTKSEKEIVSAYKTQRKLSKKANRKKDLTESYRMVSEHFRMFLSNFAKRCNYQLKRSGVWVKKKFDRWHITNEKDYEKKFELVCDLQDCQYDQLMTKYRADKRGYDRDEKMKDEKGLASIWRSSNGVYEGKVDLVKVPCELRLVRPNSDVLRKILEDGKNNQNPPKPPPP